LRSSRFRFTERKPCNYEGPVPPEPSEQHRGGAGERGLELDAGERIAKKDTGDFSGEGDVPGLVDGD
jgi:hypothetical protein